MRDLTSPVSLLTAVSDQLFETSSVVVYKVCSLKKKKKKMQYLTYRRYIHNLYK